MLSARRGESQARSRRRNRHYLSQATIGLLSVCILVCIVYLVLEETSNLRNDELLLSMGEGSGDQTDIGRKNASNKQTAIVESNGKSPATKQVVVCGGHSAPSCAECPQGHGEAWCNGECLWCSEKQECMDKAAFCPNCRSKASTQDACNNLKEKGCVWCQVSNQCLHVDSYCPKERAWKAPDPEPWFTPPNPIDKYGKTISVVLPCGSENEFFQRTIQSVHAATPAEVLKEIVVVDDNSDPPLEPSFTLNPKDYKVKFVRSDVSLGLIDAKHRGAQAASGDIIVFFDCHVKPALGYWEPFVREIAGNSRRVVVPAITILDVDTWIESGRPQGKQGGMSKCYITLDSDFKWTSDDKPWVPAMSGGLLAIARDWFFQIGGHDQQMKGWGGENIDLSLRIWRCGGEIVAAPRSYVGHMWRGSKKNTRAKYKIPANSAGLNRARAFKAHAPDMFANKTVTFPMFAKWKKTGGRDLDVSSIQAPMKDLRCNDFNWYLDFFGYIYRDGGYIPREVFQLTPDGGKTCLMLASRRTWTSGGSPNDVLALEQCTNVPGLKASSGTQYWHRANRTPQGRCCSGLRVWNTDQCIVNGLKTTVCSMSGQPAELTTDGTLMVGRKCLSVEPLRETNCDGATRRWEKLRPFEPQEFMTLSQEMKDKW